MINSVFEKSFLFKREQYQALRFIVIKNKKFLIVTTLAGSTRYFFVPNFIVISIKNKTVVVTAIKKIKNFDFTNFFNNVVLFFENSIKIYTRILILKGLGYRVSISDDNKTLSLKLGYSHNIEFKIPTTKIAITLSKTKLFFEGTDAVFLGNFCAKIRSKKLPDVYQGKGFLYKDEKIYYKKATKSLKKK